MGLLTASAEPVNNGRRDNGTKTAGLNPVAGDTDNDDDGKSRKRKSATAPTTKPVPDEPKPNDSANEPSATIKPNEALFKKVFQNMVRDTIQSKLPHIMSWIQTVIVLLVAFVLGYLIMQHLSFKLISDEIVVELDLRNGLETPV